MLERVVYGGEGVQHVVLLPWYLSAKGGVVLFKGSFEQCIAYREDYLEAMGLDSRAPVLVRPNQRCHPTTYVATRRLDKLGQEG